MTENHHSSLCHVLRIFFPWKMANDFSAFSIFMRKLFLFIRFMRGCPVKLFPEDFQAVDGLSTGHSFFRNIHDKIKKDLFILLYFCCLKCQDCLL
jgi:hypothetical protein